MVLLQTNAWLLTYMRSTPNGQDGKLYASNLFHRRTLICHSTYCEHTTKSCSGRQRTSKLQVQGVCQLQALQEDQQPILPSWTSSTASATLSEKLAAVIHVAVILQDCLASHCCINEAMCFIPFTKHDENEAIFENEDGGTDEQGG